MPITAALARGRASAVVTCLVLAGSATGALGAGASAAAPMPSASAWLGLSRSVPRPGSSSQLFGISCTSPGNCWAIGSYGTSGVKPQTRLNQALHWDGRKWSQVSAPNPDGTATGASNVLIDATCTSPASCWAVGEYGNRRGGTGAILNQALHWNGRRWSRVSTPDPGGRANGAANFLAGIRCPSPASCWAVGDTEAFGHRALNLVLHWNGDTWSAG